MIERIVLLKLKEDHANPNSVAEVADRSRAVLPPLPGVLDVRVGVAADERTSASWDISLVLHFATLEHLPPFAADPDHRAYVDEYLRPKLESITAFNFEV